MRLFGINNNNKKNNIVYLPIPLWDVHFRNHVIAATLVDIYKQYIVKNMKKMQKLFRWRKHEYRRNVESQRNSGRSMRGLIFTQIWKKINNHIRRTQRNK